ncbi:hypothetical protein JTB14_033449 [Gonioctena quinquepunctata]|nr:hypothetical protein JTB14_033449 [Gonioctena quinquepunctata]
MVRYTNEEKRDMYEVYIKPNRNSFKAQQRYGELYPEKTTPNIKMFRRLSTTLLAHNSFIKPRGPYVRRNEPINDINVLAQIRMNPGIGSRTMASECNLSKSAVNKILKRHGYHDYKYQAVQKLFAMILRECCNSVIGFNGRYGITTILRTISFRETKRHSQILACLIEGTNIFMPQKILT